METEKETEGGQEIRVGITIGDINGIGAEVIIKSLSDNRILQGCTPIIYGSTKTLNFHKKNIAGDEIQFFSCKDAGEALKRKINVVQVWDEE
ncbi:MAG: 4-hydroxythreonine-4-phosphate dehydrogenase, partial [Psychromonas sp.]